MRDFKIVLVIFIISFLFASCDENDQLPSERHVKISDFTSIQIGGSAVVEVHVDGSMVDGTVIIKGNPELVSQFDVRVVQDVLHIEASGRVTIADSIRVITPLSYATKIVLKAEQEAVVAWEYRDESMILDYLEVKTEANSVLSLFGLKFRDINIQQEAQSKVFLNSSHHKVDEFKIEKEKVVFLNDTTAIVNSEVLWYVETSTIITDGDIEYYVFSGEKTRSFFITGKLTSKLEATSELAAEACPVNNFDAILQGQSIGSVWVLNSLAGKGEGESILYYYGSPSLNYLTQGSARIISKM